MVAQRSGAILDNAESESPNSNSAVKVAVRIRPLNEDERHSQAQVCLGVESGNPTGSADCSETQKLAYVTVRNKAFAFDAAFKPDAAQGDVFEMIGRNLIDGCLDGYNATLLAYGQTGSGKTYTMGTCPLEQQLQLPDGSLQSSTPANHPSTPFLQFESLDNPLTVPNRVGVLPRTVAYLFRCIEDRRAQAAASGQSPPEFRVSVQFIELYNEELNDLLALESPSRPIRPSSSTSTASSASAASNKMSIHEDARGGIFVTGISSRLVTSLSETMHCLADGAARRVTAETQMNKTSSRSHAIFTVHIRQQRMLMPLGRSPPSGSAAVANTSETNNNADLETLSAKFHFVDLAGSERLKRTGAVGERAREGISINGGLLALGNVISALGERARGKPTRHVPYRDSKLTRLLQDSLGGNSRTWMVACVSPTDRDFVETLNTLKYASRARDIRNRVTVNQDKSSAVIAELRRTVQRLESQLLQFAAACRCNCRRELLAPLGNDYTTVQSTSLAQPTPRPVEQVIRPIDADKLREDCERQRLQAAALARANSELIERNRQLALQSVTSVLRERKESVSQSNVESNALDVNEGGGIVAEMDENLDASSNTQLKKLLVRFAEQCEVLHARVIELEAMRIVGVTQRPDIHIGSGRTARSTTFSVTEEDLDQQTRTTLMGDEMEVGTGGQKLLGDTSLQPNPYSSEFLIGGGAALSSLPGVSSAVGTNVESNMSNNVLENGTSEIRAAAGQSAGSEAQRQLSMQNGDGHFQKINQTAAEIELDAELETYATVSSVTREIATVERQIAARELLLQQLTDKTAELSRLRDSYERQIDQLQRAIQDTCAERDRALADLERARAEQQPVDLASGTKDDADAVRETYRKRLEQLEARHAALVEANTKNARLMREIAEKERQSKRLLADFDESRRAKITLARQLDNERSRAKLATAEAKRAVEKLEKRNASLHNQIRSLRRLAEQKDVLLKRKLGEIDTIRKQRRERQYTARQSPVSTPTRILKRGDISKPTKNEVTVAQNGAQNSVGRYEELLATLLQHRSRRIRIEQELNTRVMERDQLANRLDLTRQLWADLAQSNLPDANTRTAEIDIEMRSIRAQIEDAQERIDDCEAQLLETTSDFSQLQPVSPVEAGPEPESTSKYIETELQRLVSTCSSTELRTLLDSTLANFCKLISTSPNLSDPDNAYDPVRLRQRPRARLRRTELSNPVTPVRNKEQTPKFDAALALHLLNDALAFVDNPTTETSGPQLASRNVELAIWRNAAQNLLLLASNQSKTNDVSQCNANVITSASSSPALSSPSEVPGISSDSNQIRNSANASIGQSQRLDVLLEASHDEPSLRAAVAPAQTQQRVAFGGASRASPLSETTKRRSKSTSLTLRNSSQLRTQQPAIASAAAISPGVKQTLSRPATAGSAQVLRANSNTLPRGNRPALRVIRAASNPSNSSNDSSTPADADEASPIESANEDVETPRPKNDSAFGAFSPGVSSPVIGSPAQSSGIIRSRKRSDVVQRPPVELASFDLVHDLTGHRNAVLDCCFSDETNTLFTSGFDGIVKCWDVDRYAERESINAGVASHDKVTHVRYSHASRALFCATADCVRLYDVREASRYVKSYFTNGSVAQSGGCYAADSRRHETFVRGLALVDSLLFAAAGVTIRVWDTRTDQLFPKIFCAQKVTTMHVHSQLAAAQTSTMADSASSREYAISNEDDSELGMYRVLAGCKDHNIRVFDTSASALQNSTSALLPNVTLAPPHCDGVEALATSRDGRTLFSATRDGCIRKWDVRDVMQPRVADQRSNAHADWIRGLALFEPSPDGDSRAPCLLSCAKDGTVQLWNTGAAGHHKMALLKSVRAHSESVNAIRVSRTGLTFTASSDGTARIWRMRTADM